MAPGSGGVAAGAARDATAALPLHRRPYSHREIVLVFHRVIAVAGAGAGTAAGVAAAHDHLPDFPCAVTSGVGVVTYAKSRAESAQDGKNDSLGKSVAAFEEKGATRAANASTRAIPGANLMVFLLLLFERGSVALATPVRSRPAD